MKKKTKIARYTSHHGLAYSHKAKVKKLYKILVSSLVVGNLVCLRKPMIKQYNQKTILSTVN